MASCCAIGRNSADATNASLIRCARAERILRLAELVAFLCFTGFFVVFFDLLLTADADLAVVGLVLSILFPATGVTAIKAQSSAASTRAGKGVEMGDITDFIDSL